MIQEERSEKEKLEKKIEKEKRIRKEKNKIKRFLKNLELNNEKIKVSEALIENAAFMIVTLDDLKKEINTNGCVSTYKNGENQWGTKKSPEVETYNTMLKNYIVISKQIMELLPKEIANEEEDPFEEFVKLK